MSPEEWKMECELVCADLGKAIVKVIFAHREKLDFGHYGDPY
jgi:hypothetical protein